MKGRDDSLSTATTICVAAATASIIAGVISYIAAKYR
jgi:hypothetical protein